ncbi:hypothetical protein D3C78_1489780 [compost metagenome]
MLHLLEQATEEHQSILRRSARQVIELLAHARQQPIDSSLQPHPGRDYTCCAGSHQSTAHMSILTELGVNHPRQYSSE